MCRWLAYSGEPVFLEEALYAPENSLASQSLHAIKSKTVVNGDGFGVGWYTHRKTPGVYREILPAWNDRNLENLSAHISSGLFMAHVRAATHGEISRTNCHPFSHENWLFVHNGQIGGYSQIKWFLDRLIPEQLYAARQGSTDSELIFFLMLANGLETNPQAAIEKTFQQVLDCMQQYNITSAFRFTGAVSNGETIFAMRYSSDDQPPTLFWKQSDNHVLIASEPLEETDQDQYSADSWQAVKPKGLLSIQANQVQQSFLTLP